MEKHFFASGKINTTLSLQELIGNTVSKSLAAANYHNTRIVNDVQNELALGPASNEAMVVINNLLAAVVANSKNGEIHITAQRYKYLVILEIQERNIYNEYALAFSIGSMEQDAASIGGHLSMKGQQQKITTISFSFPYNSAAA